VIGLNCYQAAEAAAEHEDRIETQRTAGGEEDDANPSSGVAVDGPDFSSIQVGRQPGGEQQD
jgi:hypothetical protein